MKVVLKVTIPLLLIALTIILLPKYLSEKHLVDTIYSIDYYNNEVIDSRTLNTLIDRYSDETPIRVQTKEGTKTYTNGRKCNITTYYKSNSEYRVKYSEKSGILTITEK